MSSSSTVSPTGLFTLNSCQAPCRFRPPNVTLDLRACEGCPNVHPDSIKTFSGHSCQLRCAWLPPLRSRPGYGRQNCGSPPVQLDTGNSGQDRFPRLFPRQRNDRHRKPDAFRVWPLAWTASATDSRRKELPNYTHPEKIGLLLLSTCLDCHIQQRSLLLYFIPRCQVPRRKNPASSDFARSSSTSS